MESPAIAVHRIFSESFQVSKYLEIEMFVFNLCFIPETLNINNNRQSKIPYFN